MADKALLVLMNGRLLGTVRQTDNKLVLDYDEAWRQAPNAIPLSLSMPLTLASYPNPHIAAYMWGLLPDNELTLSEWGKRHHVSPGNCFALLGAIGEDCPGAVQFIPPEKVETLKNTNSVKWLDNDEFEELIAGLRTNSGAGRRTASGGQFSLAGAQPKTALLRDKDRWGIPSGRMPTTHILKPAVGELAGIAENEHFCLRLAARTNLNTATTEIIKVRDLPVVCVTRYDRQPNLDGQIVRLHQEDMCQSLGIHPSKKYQNEGGPGVREIMHAIGKFSSKSDADRDRFMRALAFNFIILGTDAHAKNYSFLILPGPKVRLAPLYDIGSYLPYAKGQRGIKLAMKIGGKYESDEIMPRHWQETSREVGFPPERALAHVRDLLARLPGEALGLLDDCRRQGLNSATLDRLVDELWEREKSLVRSYGAELMSHLN